jgi:hypothetical protein
MHLGLEDQISLVRLFSPLQARGRQGLAIERRSEKVRQNRGKEPAMRAGLQKETISTHMLSC